MTEKFELTDNQMTVIENALELCSSKLISLKEQNEALKSALENIKTHIEYIAGKTSKLSATWNIANDTLIKIKEGEEND